MLRNIFVSTVVNGTISRGKDSLNYLEKVSYAPMEANRELLLRILNKNKNTEFGKKHNFSSINSIEEYRKNVPLSEYSDYIPYIDRMKNGEYNLLTKQKPVGYSRTSGSSGVPKYIPATDDCLKIYSKYSWSRAVALAANEIEKNGKKVKAARGAFLSPATNDRLPNGLLCSNIAEVNAEKFGWCFPYMITVPTKKLFDMNKADYVYCIYRFALAEEDLFFITSVFTSINVSQLQYLKDNWRIIVSDIENGTISDCITITPEYKKKLLKYIKPDPKRAAYLKQQFEIGFNESLFKRLWPNLSVISSIGNASFKPATDIIRKVADGIPFDNSQYAASEGVVAACVSLESDEMQLLPDSCFCEFIPADEGEDTTKILTLDELEQGKKYEVIITTQSGFYRYRLHDIIEVKGFRNKCPMISFIRRIGQLINMSGEKFSEEDGLNTVTSIEKAHGIKVNNWIFHQDESVIPNRYALILECDSDINFADFIDDIEGYMTEFNKRYGLQREKGYIGKLTVLKQKSGTYDEWVKSRVAQGAYVAQVKPVHILDNELKKSFFLERIEKEY